MKNNFYQTTVTYVFKYLIIFILFATMSTTMIVNANTYDENEIQVENDKIITGLGAGSIKDPEITQDISIWDKVEFGSYPDAVYKKQPIKWRILSYDKDTGDALLLADKALDYKKYNESYNTVTWKYSSLRRWLNGEASGDYASDNFLNKAFTNEEQQAIITTTIITNPKDSNYMKNNTSEDKIFLLSREDVLNDKYGFDVDGDEESITRVAIPTGYAIARGVSLYNGQFNDYCYWWLLGPGYDDKFANHVDVYGALSGYGVHVDNGGTGVRPALNVNLKSQFVMDAGTVSSDGNVVDPTNDNYVRNEYNNPIKKDNITTWDCVYFGNYYQYAEYENTPIEWRVLSVKDEKLLLLADKIIDMKKFNEGGGYSWEDSDIRKWLNGIGDEYVQDSFIDKSFTDAEKDVIIETNVINKGNDKYSLKNGNDTKDKVFLLSYEEASSVGYGLWNKDNRRCSATQYVLENPIAISRTGGDKLNWWLRSLYSYSEDRVYCVSSTGDLSAGGSRGGDAVLGVRPALYVDLGKCFMTKKINNISGDDVKYRLVIKDKKIQVYIGENDRVKRSKENVITVPYTVTEENIDTINLSVVLLKEPYVAGKTVVNSEEYISNVVPDYNFIKLDIKKDDKKYNGVGAFIIPEYYRNKICGKDYFAYIIAECINDDGSDYVSEPLEIKYDEHNFIYSAGINESSNTITVCCNDEDCYLADKDRKYQMTITLNAPKTEGNNDLIYDGKPKEAFITGYQNYMNANIDELPEVEYYYSKSVGSVETGSDKLSEAPKAPGNYVAQIVWGGAVAKVPFTIKEREQKKTEIEEKLPIDNDKPLIGETSSTEDKTVSTTVETPKSMNISTTKGMVIKDESTKATYTVTSSADEEPTVEYKAPTDVAEKTVTIPETITYVPVTYKVTSISDYAFANNKNIENVVIGNNIDKIRDCAFSGCTNLKNVSISSSVTGIGDKAFKGCTSLTSIKIGNDVEEIGDGAFEGCKKLKNVMIGSNVTEIGDNAFANCPVLVKIIIPAKVNKLGKNVFKGDKKLKTIIIKTIKLTDKTVSKNAFKGVGNKVTIKVPKKLKKVYTKLFRKKGLSKKVKIK